MGYISKGSRYRATMKYQREKIDKVVASVPKGKREIYKQFAAEMGLSMSKFIQLAVEDFAERHNLKK